MVLTLAIPLRRFYGLEDFITMRHLDNMARVMLATGLIVAYGYMMETFMAWYSASTVREFMMHEPLHRAVRAALLGADLLQRGRAAAAVVQARAREPRLRSSRSSIIVNVGMWLERFIIIVVSLHRDFLPSSWGMYHGDGLGLGDVHRHDRPLPRACSSCSSASCR